MIRVCSLSSVFVGLLFAGTVSAQNLSPEEALNRMKVPDGFRARLVASEPEIRQPLTMTFDERGRLWVLQYLQYPNPAGLKAVKVDKYLRTVWDRVPEPPPHGPKGADRVTILSDPDEHGYYRKAQDFVGGLNLASGLTVGHGGVWVAQPPYLLFYPDKNGDDRPDGDPEVILKGFGMEDSHAFANSLQWGPDGWLYGAHGSTVSASIKNPARPENPPIEFEQGIWRYHPRTKEFELFSEGGGNTWGLDFDQFGRIIAGTNFGGSAMLHQVQGAYHVKNFGKHGPLHNPHTYGYFGHVPYEGFKGGHVTCGGIVYQGDAYPSEFQNHYIAGNLLSNDLYWHIIEEKKSSFTSRMGGDFLVSGDPWFRPIDCLLSPDGSVYLVDWHDKRASHLDPIDNWDRTNGRIYKVEYTALANSFPKLDLAARSGDELLELLKHPNKWYRKTARRLLAERRDQSVVPKLKQWIAQEEGLLALESLWALHVSGGLTEDLATDYLDHANAHVRKWSVRLIGDDRTANPAQVAKMIELARSDPSPTVRSQLACTAKRLNAADGLAIVEPLLGRDEDVDDPYIPMLLWWAIEDKAISARSRVLRMFEDPGLWRQPIVDQVIAERIGRRYMAEGSEEDYAACARLLALAPSAESTDDLIRGMEKALEGRRLAKVPAALEEPLAKLTTAQPDNLNLLQFAVRLGSSSAYQQALKRVADDSVPDGERTTLITLLSQAGNPDAVPVFLEVLATTKKAALQTALLSGLQTFPDPKIVSRVLELYPKFSNSVKKRAQSMLAARPSATLKMFEAVDREEIAKTDFDLTLLQQIARYDDPKIKQLLEKHWGQIKPETPGEKMARIRWLNVALGRGKGDIELGKALFKKNCATCHQLFGEGNKIGPDLTGSDRQNRMYMLTHIVDPSAFVRPEYTAFDITTLDGRLLRGLVVEQTPKTVTLVNDQNEKTVIARDDIDEMKASPISLMPEKLLQEYSDEMVCDLFAYIQQNPKK